MKLSDALAVKVGTAGASAVYVGATKVWPADVPSTDPVLVQQGVSLGANSTTVGLSVTLPSAPTAGNTLVAYFARSSNNAMSVPSGWTLVGETLSGITGGRSLYKRTVGSGESATISVPSSSGFSSLGVQEWQGSVAVTASSVGQTTAGTGSLGMGGLSAPSAKAIPCLFGMFNGSSPTSVATAPSGWTSIGPRTNGSFPSLGQVVAYGASTTSAVSAQTFTYTGTRGNGVVVLWLGAWISN
jgi:hypothetical protein